MRLISTTPRVVLSASVLLGALAAVGATGVGQAAAKPTDFNPSTVFLNSYSATKVDGGSEVHGGIRLKSGDTYTIEVQGTFSAWSDWPYRRCGKPEPSAVYRSGGRDDVPVGDDAVFRFAEPLYTGKCPRAALPRRTTTFQINLGSGSGWTPFVPDGGVPRKPTSGTHRYTETVVGTGKTPKFRIVDWMPSDNSGELMITIHEQTPVPIG
jgi:hypothetical protein